SDAYLTQVVSRYIREGVEAGDPVVIIATSHHRTGLTATLTHERFDVDSCVRTGQLMFLDARHTLSTFMLDGIPDRELFGVQMGNVIEKANAARPSGTVRAFGEMVDLLWRDGNSEAAVQLEGLWNDLGKRYRFSLLCGYTMG